MKVLILEASTTSAKAMLYDTDTHQFRVKSKAYSIQYKDTSIHNAEDIYNYVIAVGKEILDGLTEVDMIAISGTWHSVFLCDADNKSVTPVYLWSNTEASSLCKSFREDNKFVSEYYNRTGCMVNAIYPFFKLKLLQSRGYDLARYKVMGQGTYICYRLTGKRVNTACMASGTGLMNIYSGEYDSTLLKELGISDQNLSEIVPYFKTYPLNGEAAEALGLQPGIPVIPANSDGGLNQVGAGAVADGIMTFSAGTSGAIRLSTVKPTIPDTPSTWCYKSPKNWLSGAATNGCTNCIDWIRERSGGKSYSELEACAVDTVTNPVFLPFLFGERCPGWNDERKGGFFNIQPNHDIGDMYLSVQEGVLFNLYHCFEMLTAINGIPKHIRFSGGILNSERWAQMCADIFRQNLEVNENEHSSLLGGAVLAMELLGVIEDCEHYVPQVTRIIRPDFQKAEFYAVKYRKYLECYNSGL